MEPSTSTKKTSIPKKLTWITLTEKQLQKWSQKGKNKHVSILLKKNETFHVARTTKGAKIFGIVEEILERTKRLKIDVIIIQVHNPCKFREIKVTSQKEVDESLRSALNDSMFIQCKIIFA